MPRPFDDGVERSAKFSLDGCMPRILATLVHLSPTAMSRCRRHCFSCLVPLLFPVLVVVHAGVMAQADALPTPAEPAASSPSASSKPTPLEGALGVTLSYRPEFPGASRSTFKLAPGVFLRYGRFTLTNASGFATRRADDVVPGLGADLVRNDRVRVGLSLRADAGRRENSSAAFEGLGNIKPTVRLRAGASWRVLGPWSAGASWSEDVLGRNNGGYGDISAGWDTRVDADTTFSVGSSLSVANARYMQTYYGVTEAQALRCRKGYAVYTPKAGLREWGISTNVRRDFDRDWIVIAGANVSRLLGPAAASPLSTARNGWGLSAGVARQF
jgi:MipA family protein